MPAHFTGLSTSQVAAAQQKGSRRKRSTSTSPSYVWIVLRNIFNLINLALFPLLMALFYFERYKDVFVMSAFLVVNSIVAIVDEARIKHRLDQIQLKLTNKVRVMRDARLIDIHLTEVVDQDVVVVREGESIPTDGEILLANSLQVDESLLTGESNYIVKQKGDTILGGSFVITGECYFTAIHVHKGSYASRIGEQSRTFRKEKSELQKIGDRLTVGFVISSAVFGLITYFSATSLGYSVSEAVLRMTSVVSLIIPQTLIFLFTFTFSISVLKLSRMGVLVRRGSAVESLAKLDILCLDKTGTITSGELQVTEDSYWGLESKDVAKIFNFLAPQAFGRNRTFETLVHFMHAQTPTALAVKEFSQVPFNSRTKQARNQFELKDGSHLTMVYGAAQTILPSLAAPVREEVTQFVKTQESLGRRLVVGLVIESAHQLDLDNLTPATSAWAVSMKEELNPGIAQILDDFRSLGTELKIISGDSFQAISRIMENIGLDMDRALDLSEFDGNLSQAALEYNIFARAKPEHKLQIIKALQKQGKLVGMVGDGVNDVLALKLANLSVAVESGSKVAQDVSDIVLLKNNFELVPHIIFEGDNVVANLKFMNLLFITKTVQAIALSALCALGGVIFPVLPSSTLIFSFLATSLPSYAVAFFRRQVRTGRNFWQEVLPSALVAGLGGAITSLLGYLYAQQAGVDTNTFVVFVTLGFVTFYAVIQLGEKGYVQKAEQLLFSAAIALGFGLGAMVIPLTRGYYDIIDIGISNWLIAIAIGFSGILAYVISFKFFTLGRSSHL